MKTIGEILRTQREYRRLNLEEVAKLTKIKLEYLEALEANEFSQLPSATFVKGYIKTYGRLFGFDYQPLLAMLRRDYKESAKGKLLPREFLKPMLKKRRWWAPLTVASVVLGAAFLTIVSFVVFQWYSLQKPPLLEVVQPQESATVAAKVQVTGRTLSDARVTVNDQPVALQLDGSFSTEVVLPNEGIHAIVVSSTDRRGKTNTVERTVRVEF